MKRKKFIQTSTLAGLGVTILPNVAFSKLTSKKRVKIGVVGTGLRGQWLLWLMAKYPGVDIVSICDIDEKALKKYNEFRRNSKKNWR